MITVVMQFKFWPRHCYQQLQSYITTKAFIFKLNDDIIGEETKGKFGSVNRTGDIRNDMKEPYLHRTPMSISCRKISPKIVIVSWLLTPSMVTPGLTCLQGKLVRLGARKDHTSDTLVVTAEETSISMATNGKQTSATSEV